MSELNLILGKEYKNGKPCEHPGCLNHVSHPCEECGRVRGDMTITLMWYRKALSDARNKLDEKSQEITDLNSMRENDKAWAESKEAENKRLKDCIEEQRYEKHTYKKELLKKHGIEVDDFVPMDNLPKGQTIAKDTK